MITALTIAIVSVVFGTLLALARYVQTLSFVQTFATVAAFGVVFVHLLPEALAYGGLWTLVAFAAAFGLAALADHYSSHSGKSSLGLELGFLGLCIHKIGDGIALAHYTRAPFWPGFTPGPSFDVLFSIAAHSVPVTAMVVLTFLPQGRKAALLRAAILMVCAIAGVVLVDLVPREMLIPLEPWLAAVTAGLLIHIVTHGTGQHALRSSGARIADLFAALAGITLAVLGQGHPGAAQDVRHATGDALFEFALETAPVLLLGLFIAAALQVFGRNISGRWLRRGRPLQQAVRGTLVGLPLPVCACGILPVAHSLRKRGAPTALVVAFLFATPELGIETFALSVQFFGWSFALTRLFSAAALAIAAALLISSLTVSSSSSNVVEVEPLVEGEFPRSRFAFFLKQLDELLHHILPWAFIGLLAAAYIEAVLPPESFSQWATGIDFIVITMIAIPSYVCATSATPFAAVLLAKGLSPGAVLVGLLLGPATNLATAGWLRNTFGSRATFIGLGGIIVIAWILGGLTNLLELPVLSPTEITDHEHGIGSILSLILLGVLALRGVWTLGLRGWFATLREALGAVAHHGHHHHDGHSH